jgi:long-chain-alcohol oxidase
VWKLETDNQVSNVCENRDGTHHGAKLEVCMSFPGGIAGGQEAWRGSADHQARMLEYNNSMTLITLTRDRDSGEVVLDAAGQPRIKYDISAYDAESALKAIVAGAEVLLASGAKRVSTTQAGVPSYEPLPGHMGLVDPKWIEWVEKVKKAGARPGWTTYGSAHQMGT